MNGPVTADERELVLVSAADEPALRAEIARVIAFLDRAPDAPLADVAYTCALGEGPSRLAVIASDVPDLRARLASALDRLGAAGVRRLRDKSGTYYSGEHLLGEGGGKLAFVFSGVTGFYPDMLRDLAIRRSECRDAFDELEEAIAQVGNDEFTPSSFIFPPASYYRHDADVFSSGAYAQALVSTYAGCMALSRLLELGGIVPDGVVGFGGGDLSAMMRSGAAGAAPSRPDRIRVIREIYQIVNLGIDHAGLPETSMISLLLRHEGEADELIAGMPRDKVCETLDFSPRQKTYAVDPAYEDEFLVRLSEAGVRATKLSLNRPFNTEKCAKFVPYINKFTKGWMKEKPTCDVYSCASADRLPRSVRSARNATAENWSKPVRFRETILKMYEDGYRVFLEVGPRGLMTSAVSDTLRGLDHLAIALNSIHRPSLAQARHALAQLATTGVKMNFARYFEGRGLKRLDFDGGEAALSLFRRRETEMRLSRAFPRLTLLGDEPSGLSALADPKGRGAKAALRAAVVAAKKRRQRQFDWGVLNPLVSDADTLNSSPGVSIEISKTFLLAEAPFLADFAIGTSQLSYSDPNLRGLVLLAVPVGVEIMGEVAGQLMPSRSVVAVEDFVSRRTVAFSSGKLTLFVRAERIASNYPGIAAVRVQIRDDAPNSAYTWPVMEATVLLSAEGFSGGAPACVEALSAPRSVHWSGRDVYPARLCCGRLLRGIHFVENWGMEGIDYEVEVPPLAGAVSFTRFPLWTVNPLLLEIIRSGFPLWRSHERFAGAFSFPFRMRRLEMLSSAPKEGARLKCYMRLTGVTPKSHICDVTVTDGNGTAIMTITGWEELTERVPAEYRDVILQPAVNFISSTLSADILGNPGTDVSCAYVADVPYPLFERNEELWLKTMSHVVLSARERREFASMTGSASRRTEWLFGRVTAKEAVRRFVRDHYQARWSNADVTIWANDAGKPYALGEWSDAVQGRLEIAIAHTAQFVVAVAAANARAGVDVESVSRQLSEEFAAGVFTPDELELAAQTANPAPTLIRFWCAKEAVSKALGTGIRYSPKEMLVTSFLPEEGVVTVRLEGAWVEAFKAFKGRGIAVTSRILRDHALAFCFIPQVLFDDE